VPREEHAEHNPQNQECDIDFLHVTVLVAGWRL
jgi:hypothetical protein